jgi:uncharacterized protein
MTNRDKELVDKTAKFIKKKFENEGSGHDWWHLYRVWQLSKRIAKEEKADSLVTELGALLHDIADFKFHDGDLSAGPRAAREWLQGQGAHEDLVDKVCDIVENVSFKGAAEADKMKSLEGKIVQDADRLDAIGAIGISRVFSYGGHKGKAIHNPDIKPNLNMLFEQYKKGSNSAINHFYEKLLLLKDRMNTEAGKKIAEHRHQYMEGYLKEFYAEWEGKV